MTVRWSECQFHVVLNLRCGEPCRPIRCSGHSPSRCRGKSFGVKSFVLQVLRYLFGRKRASRGGGEKGRGSERAGERRGKGSRERGERGCPVG